MCGIAGYFGHGDERALKNMGNQLRHRGPDDEGFYLKGNVGLAHRRLSIIDLSQKAHQPMSNEDDTVWLTFNGEIYNFRELRTKLSVAHLFKSSTDTEVIIHLYEELGTKVFSEIDGMFALALYDAKTEKIILARDRLGKKPLYWGVFDRTLIFGSELKAILAHPLSKNSLDLKSLNKYLQYEYVPTPHTIFKNIFKLEPGHFLTYNGAGQLRKEKFWSVSFNQENAEQDESYFLKALDEQLNAAVAKRLISDVPLGVFLSGGLDSSTIAYYAARNSCQKIKTFSIGFEEDSFDESKYARMVSAAIGTEHYERILGARESLNIIPQVFDLLDEPLADASILPTFLLSQFTRDHVTVAGGGDGSDELFCGYDTFVADRLANFYESLPLFLRQNVIESAVRRLPVSPKNFSFDFKAKKFISGFYGPKKYRHQRWLGSFDKSEKSRLFRAEVWKEIEAENEFEDIDAHLRESGTQDYRQQLIYLYLRMYLMDDVLVKVDRASMFNSLEVRSPFLDTRVVDLVNGVPFKLKFSGLKTKYILKRLMSDKLPREIVFRRKKGFGIPLAEWINGDLKPLVLELLSERAIKEQGLFNYEYVHELLGDHFARRADNRKPIWTLMAFQLWWNRWYK